jgi:hypothetical protein
LINFELAQTFHTSPATTISKWKNRETCQDKSSRPHKIAYALNVLEESLAVSIRKTTWLPLDEVWETNPIEHRLTRPNTPKTNGMVERANGIIKKETILKDNYANKGEMNDALRAFLVYYILYRRHGGVRKELNVKNPFSSS